MPLADTNANLTQHSSERSTEQLTPLSAGYHNVNKRKHSNITSQETSSNTHSTNGDPPNNTSQLSDGRQAKRVARIRISETQRNASAPLITPLLPMRLHKLSYVPTLDCSNSNNIPQQPSFHGLLPSPPSTQPTPSSNKRSYSKYLSQNTDLPRPNPIALTGNDRALMLWQYKKNYASLL